MSSLKTTIKQEKKENEYIKSFSNFYLTSYFPKIKNINVECPDKSNQYKLPDYLLVEPKILVEIKEVHERDELENSIVRGYSTKRLQEEIDKQANKLKCFRKSYFLDFPWNLKIKRGQENIIADKIIKAILDKQRDIYIEEIGKFKIISESTQKKNRIILAASGGPARSINPAGTIYQNINSKIGTANKQLSALDANKNILLLVNKYPFGDRIDEFIEALSYSYQDLLSYKNIDEIWLQLGTVGGQFSHILLYTREFLTSFDKKGINTDDIRSNELFEKWFYPLQKLGDEQKEKLFIALKKFLPGNIEPHQIFADKFIREEMVRLGIWLAEKKKFAGAIWIIDRFIDDPDPEEPDQYSGDPRFNYHQQILDDEDPHIITSVLGQLAWVIQKLSVRRKYISKALDYTKNLLSHKNLYVKLQATVPLVEIAGRRQWLKGWGARPRKSEYKKFHKLVFDLIDIVEKNPNCKAIAKWLSHVFAYYKDLSTIEAKRVLEALKITEESGGLFVYFGIFRKEHYKEQPIKFNGEIFKKILKVVLTNREKQFRALRKNIMWHFWKILDDDLKQLKNPDYIEFVDLIMQTEFSQESEFSTASIIQITANHNPSLASKWLRIRLQKLEQYSKTKKEPVFMHIGDVREKLKDTKEYKDICDLLKILNLSQNVHIDETKI